MKNFLCKTAFYLQNHRKHLISLLHIDNEWPRLRIQQHEFTVRFVFWRRCMPLAKWRLLEKPDLISPRTYSLFLYYVKGRLWSWVHILPFHMYAIHQLFCKLGYLLYFQTTCNRQPGRLLGKFLVCNSPMWDGPQILRGKVGKGRRGEGGNYDNKSWNLYILTTLCRWYNIMLCLYTYHYFEMYIDIAMINKPYAHWYKAFLDSLVLYCMKYFLNQQIIK